MTNTQGVTPVLNIEYDTVKVPSIYAFT